MCEAGSIVPLHIPTHPAGPNAQEASIRFKNPIADARR
jgi:hypothetical protein